jgi:hypothetical protein
MSRPYDEDDIQTVDTRDSHYTQKQRFVRHAPGPPRQEGERYSHERAPTMGAERRPEPSLYSRDTVGDLTSQLRGSHISRRPTRLDPERYDTAGDDPRYQPLSGYTSTYGGQSVNGQRQPAPPSSRYGNPSAYSHYDEYGPASGPSEGGRSKEYDSIWKRGREILERERARGRDEEAAHEAEKEARWMAKNREEWRRSKAAELADLQRSSYADPTAYDAPIDSARQWDRRSPVYSRAGSPAYSIEEASSVIPDPRPQRRIGDRPFYGSTDGGSQRRQDTASQADRRRHGDRRMVRTRNPTDSDD